jgi:hypothetical protein
MYKKRIETFDAIRWDGQNEEIVAGQIGYPVKKCGFGGLTIDLGDKEKVTIKKMNFAIISHMTGKITTCDLDEFESTYIGAR